MTLVSACCCVDSKAATSVTVPAVTSTLIVSSLKPPPCCFSPHHLSHRKLRSPALLGDRGITVVGEGLCNAHLSQMSCWSRPGIPMLLL